MFGRMFVGRNGPDQLTLGLFILAFILSLVPVTALLILSLAIFAFSIFRMFSRNVQQRRKENLMFLRLVNKPKMWYYNLKAERTQSRLYKIFICPQCGQKLRVPRGKGKVSIKCSKCANRIIKNT